MQLQDLSNNLNHGKKIYIIRLQENGKQIFIISLQERNSQFDYDTTSKSIAFTQTYQIQKLKRVNPIEQPKFRSSETLLNVFLESHL